jgi:predicted PurR-regulated permease PerM
MNERNAERSDAAKREYTEGRVGALVLAVLTIAGVIVCIYLAIPFLGALAWAVTLAIMFAPLHERVERAIRHPNVAAIVSVLMVMLVVAIPAAFVVGRLVGEAASSIALLQAKLETGAIQRLLEIHPRIAPIGAWIEQQIDLPAIISNLAAWFSSVGASFARGSVVQAIEIALTFYFLFYFLRDRLAARRFLRDWLPLTDSETERLIGRITDTVHATIYGTVAMAAVQGTLGGVMFWVLGLPTPLLWGLVMALLSIVPVLGAFIVWIPAAAFLALDGSWGKAVILAIWGSVVVGGIDNILRPVLVGSQIRLHTVPAFISVIGGLVLFGAPGLILGPVSVAVTILLVEFWGTRVNRNFTRATVPQK